MKRKSLWVIALVMSAVGAAPAQSPPADRADLHHHAGRPAAGGQWSVAPASGSKTSRSPAAAY